MAERIGELNRLRHDYSDLKARHNEREARLQKMEQEARGASSAEIAAQRAVARRLETTLQQLRDAEARVAERDQKLEHLESKVDQLEAAARNVPDAEMSRFTALERALAARERKIRELESELELAQGWGGDAPPADDLTRIKGVGPKLSERLNAAGVRRFQEIAEWTPEDIERLAPLLKVAASRIRRDDWVQSAKDLL